MDFRYFVPPYSSRPYPLKVLVIAGLAISVPILGYLTKRTQKPKKPSKELTPFIEKLTSMPDPCLETSSLSEVIYNIQSKNLSIAQVVLSCFQKIRKQKLSQTVIDLDLDEALHKAERLQNLLDSGNTLSDLHGVPVAVSSKISCKQSSQCPDSCDSDLVEVIESLGGIVLFKFREDPVSKGIVPLAVTHKATRITSPNILLTSYRVPKLKETLPKCYLVAKDLEALEVFAVNILSSKVKDPRVPKFPGKVCSSFKLGYALSDEVLVKSLKKNYQLKPFKLPKTPELDFSSVFKYKQSVMSLYEYSEVVLSEMKHGKLDGVLVSQTEILERIGMCVTFIRQGLYLATFPFQDENNLHIAKQLTLI